MPLNITESQFYHDVVWGKYLTSVVTFSDKPPSEWFRCADEEIKRFKKDMVLAMGLPETDKNISLATYCYETFRTQGLHIVAFHFGNIVNIAFAEE